MLPTPYPLSDRIRVFYAACDDDQRGRIFLADFAAAPPFPLIAAPTEPVLGLGPAGAFDRDGVNPSQVVVIDGRLALLYIGWRRGDDAEPYTLLAGLAFSEDDGVSFEKTPGPMLAPRTGERLFRTAPFLRREANGFRLLYIGGDDFIDGEAGRRLPIYSLMELRSPDPWRWDGPGRVLLSPDRAAGEIGFGRPILWDSGGQTRLMLSIRTGSGYTLVDAPTEGDVGERPRFKPTLGAPVGDWERAMTCFGAPCVVGDHELLFYNGDGFGRTGLGLAWRERT